MHNRHLIAAIAITLLLLVLPGFSSNLHSQTNHPAKDTTYQLAFVNFGPLNTDIFIADSNGSNARPLLAHPGLDYNASFSHDGNWILFTSERNGSADIYRVHPDGSGLEQLTNDPSFDDQAAL